MIVTHSSERTAGAAAATGARGVSYNDDSNADCCAALKGAGSGIAYPIPDA